jgi:hypothetical protein
METFATYLNVVNARYRVQTGVKRGGKLRLGQTYYNVLYAMKPKLASTIISCGPLDPFYVDENLPAFLSYVADAWNIM